MKKITIVAMSIFLLAACTKESTTVTKPISASMQSDPDLSLPPLACGAGGGAVFYCTITIQSHVGKVHGPSVNKTCSPTPDGKLAITSDDITFFATNVGGTGRFEGQTGYFIYENMVVDLVTGHESHTSHGKITLVRD